MTFGRWLLHARIGALGAIASSDGGTTERLAFRAGIDAMRRIRTTVALAVGLEWQAGWYGGFDAAIVRATMQKRFGRYRGMLAFGVPLEGNDRTTVVFTFGIARDL